MSCFPCISPRKRVAIDNDRIFNPFSAANSSDSSELEREPICSKNKPKALSSARRFTYEELTVATKNFKDSNLVGEGGFGKVYKGRLDDGQVIAAKKLNLESLQGNQEFIVEVLMLSLLHDPYLVTLIGYCAEGNQRILVYEYMAKGSLADHLFGKHALDWTTRLKIAAGAARGMKYLHCVAKPAVIYRDVKSANILLDEDFNPKLSDFGLAKLGPQDDKTHVSTRVMGTYGYCAPEYAASGKLSPRSDIYSFGVVLMEILTGRKALDNTKHASEQNLVAWSRRLMKDKRRHRELVDPRLKGQVTARSFRRYLTVTEMCLRERANLRPSIEQVLGALEFLAFEALSTTSGSSTSAPSTPTAATPPPTPPPTPPASPTPLFSHHNKVFSQRKNIR